MDYDKYFSDLQNQMEKQFEEAYANSVPDAGNATYAGNVMEY